MTAAESDLEFRLTSLRAASRTNEPLTDKDGLTAEGHLRSAITKLERQLAKMRLERK